MKYINKKTIFVTLFALLYLCVGLVSTIHATEAGRNSGIRGETQKYINVMTTIIMF